MLILAEIGDVERFPSARHLCACAGLTPTVAARTARPASGTSATSGPGALRWALIEAGQKNTQGGGSLAETFGRIAERRGRQIAKVAVARKILTLCFCGLRDGEISCFKAAGRRTR
jgi:transposase